jgi:hypothetical protein
MRTRSLGLAVVARVMRYFDRLFERVEDRVEARVVERVEATLDVLADPELVSDLEKADRQADSDARPFDEIRAARSGRA